jgi:hypothetical protein
VQLEFNSFITIISTIKMLWASCRGPGLKLGVRNARRKAVDVVDVLERAE